MKSRRKRLRRGKREVWEKGKEGLRRGRRGDWGKEKERLRRENEGIGERGKRG